MVGRPRHELQAGTLLEFFGDPKLARGIVACLGRSYAWHQQSFEEVLEPETWAAMRDLGLTTPVDLRAHLYRYVNVHHHVFLPTVGRPVLLEPICAQLPLSRSEFAILLTLD